MPVEMVSPFRSRTLRTKAGHCIAFAKNEAKSVPDRIVEEALGQGLVTKEDYDSERGVDPVAAQVPEGNERDVKIREAIETIMDRTERDDWNGAGQPAKDAIGLITGFKVDQRVANRIFKEIKEAAIERAAS